MPKSKIVKGCPRVTIIKDTVFYYTDNQGRIQIQFGAGFPTGNLGQSAKNYFKIHILKCVFLLLSV